MGNILLTTGTNVTLNGILPQGTEVVLEALDLGPNIKMHNWLEPWARPGGILTAVQDRQTQMVCKLWLDGVTPARLVTDAETIRNAFLISNTLQYSPDYPAIPAQTISTYPSEIPPLLSSSNEDNLRYMTKLVKVFDWTLVIWRAPFFAGQTVPPLA